MEALDCSLARLAATLAEALGIEPPKQAEPALPFVAPLLAELAGKYGVSQAQICLRFALDCGVVPLPKSADAGRMRQNLALDFALEAEDLERLRTMPQTGWSGLHPDK